MWGLSLLLLQQNILEVLEENLAPTVAPDLGSHSSLNAG